MEIRISIINGPNLNRLGTREPELYGGVSFETYLEELRGRFPGCRFSYHQSNIEGELVGFIHRATDEADAIIINPAAYTHTSVAIADALAMAHIPVVEVHITNLLNREEFRHTSLTGRHCSGSVMGFGLDGYRLATEALLKIITR